MINIKERVVIIVIEGVKVLLKEVVVVINVEMMINNILRREKEEICLERLIVIFLEEVQFRKLRNRIIVIFVAK